VSEQKPRNGYVKAAAIIVAVAVLPLAACSGSENKASSGDTVTRAATGDLTVQGGARRLAGDPKRLSVDQSTAIRDAISDSGAKNVILLIGDGMGDSEITIARNYALGAGGSFTGIDAFPLTGSYTTYALKKDGKPDYVTDSAASASAWSTGTKTFNGALSVDIKGKPQKTILQLAKDQGFATGDITTSEIQDATPAALFSHITGRKCYGPNETAKNCSNEALENGGLGSITEQMLAARPDITMGGGAKTFAQTAKGGEYKDKTLEVQAKERGYQIVRTASELTAITKADNDAPLLGLFDDGNMPVSWTGPEAVRQGYLQPAAKCTDNPKRGAEVPKLADMTKKSIDLLSGSAKGKDKGFFLQVESASIDKRDHAADPCGQIGETVVFDEAVQAALAFARTNADTLVIATADHGHTSQVAEPYSEEDLQGIAAATKQPIERVRDVMYPGLTRLLTTKDDAEMLVSYGTSADLFVGDEGHTGTQVRLAAYGPHAANVVGLTDQSDLFFTMTDALGIKLS
jgi:alkaline phosphatase